MAVVEPIDPAAINCALDNGVGDQLRWQMDAGEWDRRLDDAAYAAAQILNAPYFEADMPAEAREKAQTAYEAAEYAVVPERVPEGDCVVRLAGGFWDRHERLWKALAGQKPTAAEIDAAALRVWNVVLGAVELQLGELEVERSEVTALEFRSSEWDNGWFPDGVKALSADGQVVADLDESDEGNSLPDGDLYRELYLLSGAFGDGFSFQPGWSYKLRRPHSA